MGNQCSIGKETCGGVCTGYQGGHRWQMMRDAAKEFDEKVAEIAEGVECGTCQPHAVKLASFMQDHVAISIGEPEIFDKNNYNEVYDEIVCAHDKCKRDGRC